MKKDISGKSGSLTPLVLVHGYRGAPAGFAELEAALFTRGFRVYAPQMPPCGESLPEYTPQSYADFLAEYLHTHKIEHPVLIGHSMGSIIVAAFAEKHPDLAADEIIFLSPIARKVPKIFAILAPLATVFPNALVSFLTTRYLIVTHGQPKGFFKKVYKKTVECGRQCVSKKGDRGASRFSSSFAISDFDFKKKALFLAGRRDKMNSEKAILSVAKKYGGEVKFVEHAGHLINYEQPGEVAEIIEKYLG